MTEESGGEPEKRTLIHEKSPSLRDRLTLSYWNQNWDEWEDTRSVEDAEFHEIVRAEGYIRREDFCLAHHEERIGRQVNQCKYRGPRQLIEECRFLAPLEDKG